MGDCEGGGYDVAEESRGCEGSWTVALMDHI